MIQKFSTLKVVDGSGARLAKCIHIYGGYRQRYGYAGTKVLLTILSLRRKKNRDKNVALKEKAILSKGTVIKGIIVRTKTNNLKKKFGKCFFIDNGVVLLNNKNALYSSKIYGGVLPSLRKKKFYKAIAISAKGLLNV